MREQRGGVVTGKHSLWGSSYRPNHSNSSTAEAAEQTVSRDHPMLVHGLEVQISYC